MISSIQLHNFKCWTDATLPLGALTLVSGLNGAGKSSVLQSLLVLRQSHDQGLLANGRLAINGDLVTLGTGADAFCEQAEDDELRLGINWIDGECATWSFAYDRLADVLGTMDETTNQVPARPPFLGEVFYLSAERMGPRVSGEVSDYRVRDRREVGSRGELVGHFLAVHGRDPIGCSELAHPDGLSDSLESQVEAWLGEVTPGTRLHLNDHRGLDAVQIRYSFEGGAGGTNEYRATNVGFGLSYTLPILVATLAAKPGGLLIIENPEAHLHPRGQVRIGELLAGAAAAGVQVIVETHSDHILNGLRLAVHAGGLSPSEMKVHFFERRDSLTGPRADFLTPVLDEDGRLTPWPSGFFDEIETSLSRLLEPRSK
ncbi:DUF3696 domain-containing protein [Pseudomonas entomophila]|uniref:DUF3696 domain-containing protein n=1 Tax=Pseudomonas entomophila TaxID=312306 RepID=UPI0023D7D623|nr:DUF3696 domain-containing protein [Pseudomonas entomophila]MDF0731387.1 DUF3696 domain-containing protein [Pseudomonas entomophila]